VNQGQRARRFFHLASSGCKRIRFKSITPQDDVLLIKFDSSAQSAAAKSRSTERRRTVHHCSAG
jgi:hypothetical protein